MRGRLACPITFEPPFCSLTERADASGVKCQKEFRAHARPQPSQCDPSCPTIPSDARSNLSTLPAGGWSTGRVFVQLQKGGSNVIRRSQMRRHRKRITHIRVCRPERHNRLQRQKSSSASDAAQESLSFPPSPRPYPRGEGESEWCGFQI
jgi:hypothetical protein